MKFHRARDMYDMAGDRATTPPEDFFGRNIQEACDQFDQTKDTLWESAFHMHTWQARWRLLFDRPFYNVWPIAQEVFSSIKFPDRLTILEAVRIPETVCACLPVEDELSRVWFGGIEWRNVGKMFGLVVEYRDRIFGTQFAADRTVPECLEGIRIDGGDAHFGEAVRRSLVIALACNLMYDDPNLVERVILSKDRKRGHVSGPEREAAEARALRRGINGWDVGRRLTDRGEMAPHFRRSHFAIRWTGKGAKVPKLRPIKSCFVKPKDWQKIPTGYLGYITAEAVEAN